MMATAAANKYQKTGADVGAFAAPDCAAAGSGANAVLTSSMVIAGWTSRELLAKFDRGVFMRV